MKILITGGTGLIGSHFIQHYPEYEYTLLTRYPSLQKKSDNISIITTLNELRNLDQFDAVINLCGEPIMDKRWSKKQKAIIQDSRWTTTAQITNLFKSSLHPPRVFLSGSAIGFYGDTAAAAFNEDHQSGQQDFASDLCFQWESIANKTKENTRLVNLRTGIVLAKNKGALGKMLPAFQLHLGGRIGNGKQYMSWIHIQDMISAMHFLLTQENCQGAYNLTAPEPVTNQEFSQALASTLKRKALLPMPELFLKLVFGESASLLTGSQRIIPQKLLDQNFNFAFDKLDKALSDLLI